jgi:hypothetical protein
VAIVVLSKISHGKSVVFARYNDCSEPSCACKTVRLAAWRFSRIELKTRARRRESSLTMAAIESLERNEGVGEGVEEGVTVAEAVGVGVFGGGDGGPVDVGAAQQHSRSFK